MKFKFFYRLGMVWLAALAALAASGQTYTFTPATFGGGYDVTGYSEPDPQITVVGGASVTLNISVSQPLFLTAASPPNTSSQNYYAVNPGAFSNSSMSSPTTSASVVFTPPASNSTYNLYYVDQTSGFYGTIQVVVFPDATTTVSLSRGIVPTNGPATVTVVPKNNGNVINTSSSYFTMSVSTGGGSVSGLSPSSGTNFTAAYIAGTNAGTFTISDGFGGSVPVSVIKSLPLTSFTVSKATGGQPQLTAKGFSNIVCQVTMTTNLVSPWTNIGSVTSSVSGQLQFTDTNSPYPAKRFYRLAYP